jgi:hypothetical protein
MPRLKALLPLALATLSATTLTATCVAQAAYPAGPGKTSTTYMQTQPAPIQRGAPMSNSYNKENEVLAAGQTLAASTSAVGSQPTQGVYIRVGDNSSVKAVTITPERTEFRVERGIANIVIDHPQQGSEIFVDLPGGQVALLKDGLYTFNAHTDTARVLHGEASAYPGANATPGVNGTNQPTNEKPIKVKQEHEVIFNSSHVKSAEFQPYQARADMIPFVNSGGQRYTGSQGYGGGQGYAGGGEAYGDSPYGYGFYANPYYAYGYPGLWGDPYWNYGLGLGFGYGGFGWGGGYGGYGGYYGGRGFVGRGGYYGGHGFSGGHGGFSGGHGSFSGGQAGFSGGGGSRGGGGGRR